MILSVSVDRKTGGTSAQLEPSPKKPNLTQLAAALVERINAEKGDPK